MFFAVKGLTPKRPLDHAKVIFTKYSTRECDDDNLASSFKAIRDSLVTFEILKDDKMKNITAIYRQDKCKRGDECITIEIIECDKCED